MNIEQLKQIAALTDRPTIVQELEKLGYHAAVMEKKYRDFSILNILKGSKQETEWQEDVNEKYEYKCSIYKNVDGAEGAEFVAISVNKIDKKKDMSIPYQVLWFVKEEKA